MTPQPALQTCLQHNVKVYPISVKHSGKWKIQINNNGNLTTFDKEVYPKELNQALEKTILFIAKKL